MKPLALALIVACLPSLTACWGGKHVKPLPPGETEKQYPPVALTQKEARPIYQPGREWAYIVEYADELEGVISRYECKMTRLAAWSQGNDPARVECGNQNGDISP
jgi:hypothetical protein